MTRHPTVLITLRYGFAARNVLRTGTFRGLREAGCRMVIVCPAAHEAYLQDELASSDVVLEPYPLAREGGGERVFAAVADAVLFDHPGTTQTITIKWRQLLAEGKLAPFVAKAVLAMPRLHRSRRLRTWAEQWDRRRFRHPAVGAVLDRHRPDLVVTTDLFGIEAQFVREARRRGIRSVCLVKSWDNLTSKGRIRVHPDALVVWSELMREEAVRLHFFPAERIFVSGAPNFDIFKAGGYAWMPRGEFMRSIGADPESRLVVYSPGGKLTRSDDENIRLIHRVLRARLQPFRCHLHVRKYPKSPQDYSHLLHLPGLTVEEAGIVVPSWDDRVDQPRAEMVHLAQLMLHTDVLIQIGSTIAVDAACFDRPVIGYFLDAQNPRVSPHQIPRRVFAMTHNRYLVDLGGVWVVRTEAELAAALRAYLSTPQLHREGRRRIVERICGIYDGRAGDRIAGFLLRCLGEPAALERAVPSASSSVASS